ncbi:hypothetical protein [Mycobacterium sp. URHB0021]
MSEELSLEAEEQLGEMSTADFNALCARVRPLDEPLPLDPKERAISAMRRELGIHARGTGTSAANKARAAAAMRKFRSK